MWQSTPLNTVTEGQCRERNRVKDQDDATCLEGRKALEVNDGRHKRDMGKWNDWKWHLVLDKWGYDNAADGDDAKL